MKTDADAHLLAQQIEAMEKGAALAADMSGMSEETAQLLQLADELHSLPPARPSDEFRQAARARLVNRVALSAPTRPRAVVPLWRPNRASMRPAARVLAVAALLLVFITTGTVYASSTALPGDLVYPVKGWVEAVRLQLSPADRAKELRQQYVRERAAEIQALIEQERYTDLPGAFDQIEMQVGTLSLDPASKADLYLLRAELSKQDEVLSALLETVSEEARPAIEQALNASARSQEQFSGLVDDTPSALPPGQEDKERPVTAPPLPSQAGPKSESPPATDVESSPQVTPQPDESVSEPPVFTPPGQTDKDNEKQSKPESPRGSSASAGRGQKGKPPGSPGRPPFRATQVPPTP